MKFQGMSDKASLNLPDRQPEDVVAVFVSRLLKRAAIVMGDLDIDREDWWVEFRPGPFDTIRLRYLSPYPSRLAREGGAKRRWVDWRISLYSIHMHESNSRDRFIDNHLHWFREKVRAS